jgi:mannan endo-1,4-beta-mannosidase
MKTFSWVSCLTWLSIAGALAASCTESGEGGTGTGGSGQPGNGGTSGTAGLAGTTGAAGTSGSAGTAGAGGSSNLPGFRVQGRHLYDRCGVKVVLRGVNEMIVWSGGKDGVPEFAEIARTGANAVRIVWHTVDGTAAELDRAIGNALGQQLIPIPELHDATGDRTKISAMVDYWVRPDVVAVARKYEQNLIVNIANEAGDGNVTAAQYQSDYETAISRMRAAGYRVPLMLDAPSWGQNIDVLQATGPALVTADPDHNIMLSVHMWWNDPSGTRVMSEINQSITADLPLVVGEFAHHAVANCAAEPFGYQTLLAVAQSMEVGWLAWSWGSVKNNDCANNGPFDMTTAGTFATLADWGLEVAVTDPNSIQQTSVRPRSVATGSCQ